LVEGEARIAAARPRQDERETGEDPGGRAHPDRPEVAPVDLRLLASERVEPQVRLGPRGRAHRADVALHLDGRAGITPVAHHGPQPRGAQARVLFERRRDERLVRIERARPNLRAVPDEALALDGAPDGVVMHAELRGDGVEPPVLGVEEPADLRVQLRRDHGCGSQSCNWRTSAKSPRPARPAPARGGRGGPITRSMVTSGVRVRLSTVACQRGETHSASSAATPSAPYRGRPYHRAMPSASVSSARGWCGASGSRALRIGTGPSCTSTRVSPGPGRTPIPSVRITRLLVS